MEHTGALFIFISQSLGTDHFGIGQCRTIAFTDRAERHIGDTGHGGKEKAVFYFNIAKFHLWIDSFIPSMRFVKKARLMGF